MDAITKSELDYLFEKTSGLYEVSDGISEENPYVSSKVAEVANKCANEFITKLAKAVCKVKHESPTNSEAKHADIIKYTSTKQAADLLNLARTYGPGAAKWLAGKAIAPVIGGTALGTGIYLGGSALIDKAKREALEVADETQRRFKEEAGSTLKQYVLPAGLALAGLAAGYMGSRAQTPQAPAPAQIPRAPSPAQHPKTRQKLASLIATAKTYRQLEGTKFSSEANSALAKIVFGR